MTAAFHGEHLWTVVKSAHNARCFLPAPRDPLFCIPERTVHVHESKGTCSFQLSVFSDEYMFPVLMLFEDRFKESELGLGPTFFSFLYFLSFLTLAIIFIYLFFFLLLLCPCTIPFMCLALRLDALIVSHLAGQNNEHQ